MANSYGLEEFAIFREIGVGVPGGEAIIDVAIADAAGRAARIDAAQFRADLDAIVDPHTDG